MDENNIVNFVMNIYKWSPEKKHLVWDNKKIPKASSQHGSLKIAQQWNNLVITSKIVFELGQLPCTEIEIIYCQDVSSVCGF